MNEQAWSPEPWRVTPPAKDGFLRVIDTQGRLVAYAAPGKAEQLVREHNACAGIKNPEAIGDLRRACKALEINTLSLPRSHVAGALTVDRNDYDAVVAALRKLEENQ